MARPRPAFFNESVDSQVGVDQVGVRLLPLFGVSDDIVQMTSRDLSNIAAGPEVNFICGTLAAILFVHMQFRCFSALSVRLYRLDETLNHPAVIRRQEHVDPLRWWLRLDALHEVPLNDARQLRKQNVRRNLRTSLAHVLAGQVARHLEDQLLHPST
jgi:hypothetical protein